MKGFEKMSKLNQIQSAITSLGAGAYQKLMDSYIMKKYGFCNIQPLGSHSGTDKTTKGTPDSFVQLENGLFVLIAHGSVSDNAFKKVESDVISCLDESKTGIKVEDIDQIICCHTSTNFTPGQIKSLCSHFENTTLIGLGEVSFDLFLRFPDLAHKCLGIELDTHQIFDYRDFVEYSKNNAYSTTLDMPLLCRESELEQICSMLSENPVTIILGQSGIGKTRLALEAAQKFSLQNNYVLKIIRNNGESIYEDIKSTFTDDNNYLVIVDDGDQLTQVNHLLDICVDKNRTHSFKILLTVRDYAKEKLLRTIQSIVLPSVFVLHPLTSENIKTVLSNNLGIQSEAVTNQILKIAKGNIRLAIMAGMCALDGNFENLRNSFDIFNNYYSEIIAGFDRNELIVASLIGFFDSFMLSENCLPLKIALTYGIDSIKFKEICSNLRSKEVISIYETQAVKFENQNLRDYLLYYVFFKEKWLKPSEMICLSFPAYRNRVVFAFNTLVNLFFSDDNVQYIENEVKKAWATIKSSSNDVVSSFIEAFHLLIPDETLLFVKQQIELLPEYHEDLLSFDFESNRNYHYIRSKLIDILSGFKYTDRFEDAIYLALSLFERTTEHPMDIYFLFSEKWGFGHESYKNNYHDELLLINQLICYHDQSKSNLSALCLLFAASSNLKLEFSATEATSADAVSFIRFGLAACDEIYNIRKLSFMALRELYISTDFHRHALKELLDYDYYIKKPSDNAIVEHDICVFSELFAPSLDIQVFENCMLLEHVECACNKCSIPYPSAMPKCKDNPVYNIYFAVKKDYFLEYKDLNAAQIAREHDISTLVAVISDDELSAFWLALKGMSNTMSSRDEWEISTGIDVVFSALSKCSKTRLLVCCASYFDADTPFCQLPAQIVKSLINRLGFSGTLSFIEEHSFYAKDLWLATLYDQIPISAICEQTCNKIIECLTNPSNRPNIVSLKTVLKINSINPGYLTKYIAELNAIGMDKPFYMSMFLQQVNFQENLSQAEFVDLFKDDMQILIEAYINALRGRDYYDSEGEFLTLIVQKDVEAIKQVVRVVQREHLFRDDYNCLNALWAQDNYIDFITMAMDYIRENDDFLSWVSLSESLLMRHSKDAVILERQDNWVKQYIILNHSNIECMKFLFNALCNCSKEQLHEAIMIFCKFNQSFEDFKLFHLVPTHFSWSGSEVPYIEKQIQFFMDLKNDLSGFDFIEHRAYLSEKIKSYQQRKEAVLLQEYLKNS